MSNAPITFRNLDYMKYRSLMIDGDSSFLCRCSKEVKAFYESTQILKSRSTQFERNDGTMLVNICGWYKFMLEAKKVLTVDMKLRSGWWGDSGKGMNAGKIKTNHFKEVLMAKCQTWHKVENYLKGHDMAGIFVFLHKTVPCFRFVGKSNCVLKGVEDLIRSSFDGRISGSLSALLVTSLASSWNFYLLPIDNTSDLLSARWLQNDIILRHDSIWPQGLNSTLEITSNKDFMVLRQSCLRHHWPPTSHDYRIHETKAIDLLELVKELQSQILVPPWVRGNFDGKCQNKFVPTPAGLSFDEIKLSSDCLDTKKHHDDFVSGSSSGSSIISSITTTTVRTALESNELERNRQDLIVKLNNDLKRNLLKESTHKTGRRTCSSSFSSQPQQHQQPQQKTRSISCNRFQTS